MASKIARENVIIFSFDQGLIDFTVKCFPFGFIRGNVFQCFVGNTVFFVNGRMIVPGLQNRFHGFAFFVYNFFKNEIFQFVVVQPANFSVFSLACLVKWGNSHYAEIHEVEIFPDEIVYFDPVA